MKFYVNEDAVKFALVKLVTQQTRMVIVSRKRTTPREILEDNENGSHR